MSDGVNNSNHIRDKFRKIYQELDYIEDKIFKKDGFIFKTHTYKQEELLESSHHRKIESISRKIGSDIQYWEVSGKLSREEKEVYLEEREAIDDALHNLNRKIQNREATLWEKISMNAEKFVRKVMAYLPELNEYLVWIGKNIGKIPYVGKTFTLLYRGTQHATRLITR